MERVIDILVTVAEKQTKTMILPVPYVPPTLIIIPRDCLFYLPRGRDHGMPMVIRRD